MIPIKLVTPTPSPFSVSNPYPAHWTAISHCNSMCDKDKLYVSVRVFGAFVLTDDTSLADLYIYTYVKSAREVISSR